MQSPDEHMLVIELHRVVRVVATLLVAGTPLRAVVACGGTTESGPSDAGQVLVDARSDGVLDSSPTGDAGALACPSNLAGPRLVPVQTPTGHNYCIGATEVTNAQYAAFVAANPNELTGQSAVCTWLKTSHPYPLCRQDYDPVNKPDFPINCVTWCSAQAYCKWAGQRLCGRVGAGSFTNADLVDPSKDEWFSACSAGGAKAYPYGDAYDGRVCNGADYSPGDAGTLPFEQVSGCTGGVAGLIEMSGNVAEWEDACDGTVGETDLCTLRGGHFGSMSADLRCDGLARPAFARNAAGAGIGIRCCY